MTFRLHDARTGTTEPVRPRLRGLLRVSVAGGVRDVVVADVVRRLAGRLGWQTEVTRVVPDGADHGADHGADRAALRREALDAGAAPADEYAAAAPDGVDVHVGDGDPEAAVVLRTGALHLDAPPAGDPLALRLALLGHPYAEPAAVTAGDLAAAAATLRDWRDLVARWAAAPGKPMCAEIVANLDDALAGDLGTPRALDVLHALAADGGELPDGSRFETFVYADRVLGLDLPAGLGQG